MAFEGLNQDAFRGSELAVRLWTAARKRISVAEVTDVYRLVDAEADGLPGWVIERYGDFAVVNVYGRSQRYTEQAVAEALRALGARGVYIKDRVRADLRAVPRAQNAPEQPAAGEQAPPEFAVREHAFEFLVRLADGFSTGLFVDQRDNRQWLNSVAAGKRVLNLFAYTGSFSVAAGVGGALQVTTVDLSQATLRRCDLNLKRNNQNPKRHRLLRSDAVDWLRRAVLRQDKYDLIVLDPPSFASDGAETFSVARQYASVVAQCFRLLSASGQLLAVTNHRGMSVSDFRETVRTAALDAGRRLGNLELPAGAADCPLTLSAPDLATKSAIARVV